VECLHVNPRLRLLAPRLTAEYTGSPFQKLTTPLRDLIRVNVKLLRQFRQRLLALNGGQGHLRLECQAVVPAGSLAHLHPCHTAIMAAVRQKIHLTPCAACQTTSLVTGFVFLCVLPSTVQSSIAFTSIARGNVAAALCAASASNLLGVFISPILAGWLLQAQGAALSFSVFSDITLQLLLPFFAGQLVRPMTGSWVQRNKTVLGYADRGSILLIIYVAFSQGMNDGIWTEIQVKDLVVLILLLCALFAIALVATGYIGHRVLRFSVENEIVLQFCGSKKSLASGLPVATVMFAGPTLGMIILPLMLFHQIQLMVCAVLARRYAHREDRADHDAGNPAQPTVLVRRAK
jgi:solute carrier family 10 (sodium/bile acid cotransporter), member 7